MAELSEKQRDRLSKSDFAYVDSSGEGHLPIHDEAHVRNAVSRWNQTHFENAEAKERARKRILSAAKKHGIELSPDDKITGGRRSRGGRSGS